MKRTKLSEILMGASAIILLITLVLTFPFTMKYWKESEFYMLINHFDEMKYLLVMYGVGAILYIVSLVLEKKGK